jgi:hypothetical protein
LLQSMAPDIWLQGPMRLFVLWFRTVKQTQPLHLTTVNTEVRSESQGWSFILRVPLSPSVVQATDIPPRTPIYPKRNWPWRTVLPTSSFHPASVQGICHSTHTRNHLKSKRTVVCKAFIDRHSTDVYWLIQEGKSQTDEGRF